MYNNSLRLNGRTIYFSCLALPHLTLLYFALYFTSLHFASLHFFSLYFSLLYFTSLYLTLLYFILHFASFHFNSLLFTFLSFPFLYFTLLSQITLPYSTFLTYSVYFTYSHSLSFLYFFLLYFTLLYLTLLLFTLLYFTFKWADWRRRARGLRGFDSESVDFRSLTGSKQTINRRLTLDDSGDLMIHNTTFGDAGRFMCIVQNVRFFSGIIHNLRIECKFYF